MDVSKALDDIKAFVEGDPLIRAVANLPVSDATRGVLADVVSALASEVYRASQDAAAQAVAGLDQQAPQ